MTTAATYAGWAITVTQTPYFGGAGRHRRGARSVAGLAGGDAMTTATATRADIWAMAADAKRAADREVDRRGQAAQALLGVMRRLNETCGVELVTEDCEVLFPGDRRSRWTGGTPVVEWQGAQWVADGHYGKLWCHRPGWATWRTITKLADLA